MIAEGSAALRLLGCVPFERLLATWPVVRCSPCGIATGNRSNGMTSAKHGGIDGFMPEQPMPNAPHLNRGLPMQYGRKWLIDRATSDKCRATR